MAPFVSFIISSETLSYFWPNGVLFVFLSLSSGGVEPEFPTPGPRFNTLPKIVPKILPKYLPKSYAKKINKCVKISILYLSPKFGRIVGSVLNRGPGGGPNDQSRDRDVGIGRRAMPLRFYLSIASNWEGILGGAYPSIHPLGRHCFRPPDNMINVLMNFYCFFPRPRRIASPTDGHE